MPSRRRLLTSAGVVSGLVAGCTSLQSVARERWRTPLSDQEIQPRLASREGTVFAASGDGQLHALDLATGDVRWSQQLQSNFAAGPTLADDQLYVGDYDLLTVTLDNNGSWDLRRWLELMAFGENITAIVVGDSHVFVGNDYGEVCGVTEDGPQPRWRTSPGARTSIRPVVSTGGQVVVYTRGDESGPVAALSAEEGAMRWRHQFTDLTHATFGGGLVFVAHRGGVTALSGQDGEPQWWEGSVGRANSLAVGDSAVYVVSESPPRLTALSKQRGQRQWETALDGVTYDGIPPTVADGRVYVPEVTGNRLSAYTTGGERAWTVEFDEQRRLVTSPVFVDGTVVVGVEGSMLGLRG
jgi:outer membrane protein assembly factor BamB